MEEDKKKYITARQCADPKDVEWWPSTGMKKKKGGGGGRADKKRKIGPD